MRLAAGFPDQTTAGAISTEAGPSVKNPAGYHHGTGVVQILIAIRTTTETSTIKARETVASRRILATTQPPIAVVTRNTTGARTTRVVSPGAISFEIAVPAENLRIAIAMYTLKATINLGSQSPLRNKDQMSDGTERQV
jgi:hypothetical protein